LKTKIKDITNIQTGLFAKPSGKGDVVYLQSKHFDEKGQLRSLLHSDLKSDNIITKHMLQTGDVLFAAKGTRNFAAVYENHNKSAVASTSFFVIRIADKTLLSEYLVWFLNHPSTQSVLKSNARGTAIPSIRKSVLDELEISLPSLEKQKLIVKLSKLANKEAEISTKIISLKKSFIEQKILQGIK